MTTMPSGSGLPGSSPSGSTTAAADLSARGRILAVAEVLFADGGFDRTSTASIARAAGVPQSLIFYHFGTKQELLLSLMRERADTTLAALALPEPTGDLHRTVADLWRHLRDHIGPPSPMNRIVARESSNHPALRERAEQFERESIDQVAHHLATAAGRTGAPTPEQRTAARLLVIGAAATERQADDPDPDVLARLLVDGLA